ncbi:MarR family winged helix-turn-helix transcriptional regulator [Herbiconiux moechotypicola]|uniref:MarR family transcriptional regulator n=1 Tax=Herbiconiux moechotypicola TaxID=637393 RepID=A0ABN3DF34_9MICO|nr:MarR family winged helix-turn-helix transcriptional regulator [Herbiconiux moechotypicola]MCS5729369.1 MarR family winged helix-turn-helix transcriptional regulator [Herbiconiux moechotypicola]
MATTPRDPEGFSWEESLPYTLWRTQNAVHRYIQGAIEGLGVTVTQLGLAVHLDKLGPLSASDMSRGFRITPQSVATALARLDKIGWVERRPHPVHGRVILYELSPAGLEGVRVGSQRMAEVTERVNAVLSPEGSRSVVLELRKILLELEGSDRPMELLWPIRTA